MLLLGTAILTEPEIRVGYKKEQGEKIIPGQTHHSYGVPLINLTTADCS